MINENSVLSNIKFNAGNLTSDGGAVLMSSFIENMRYLDTLGDIEPEMNDSRKNATYSNTDLIRQLLSFYVMGYFRQSDAKHLAHDPLISSGATIASQSTLSLLMRRATARSNTFLLELTKKIACSYVRRHLKDIIIDIDSTEVKTFGKQEGTAFITHYQHEGYHPLIINEGNTGLALLPLLRPGNTYSGNGAVAAIEQVLPLITGGESIPNRTIHMRGDSAFYNAELIDYLDDHDIEFYVRTKSYEKIVNKVYEIVREMDMKEIMKHSKNNPIYGEFSYKMTNAKQEYRIIYKATPIRNESGQTEFEPDLNVYCIITNSEKSPEDAMKYYEKRGAAENCNKEIKNHFDAGTLSHKTFAENDFEFLLKALAYNFYHLFREIILEGTDQKMMMSTFRERFQKIGAKVTHHSRRTQLSFSSAYTRQKKFQKYLDKVLSITPELVTENGGKLFSSPEHCE